MFDMRRVDDRDHVFRDPIWGVFYLLTVYIILLMLGSRTNRNCLPNDGSFYFGGIVVSTSLFPNSGRSA